MEQFLLNGLCRGFVYAAIGAGFTLIYSTTSIFHIAHSAVCVATAYASYMLTAEVGLPLLVAIPTSLVVAVAVGVGIELTVYRPLVYRSGAQPLVLLLSSLSVNVVLTNLLAVFFGSQPRVLRHGVQGGVLMFGLRLTEVQQAQILILLPLAISYALFLRKRTLGHLLTAMADNSRLVALLGYDVKGLRLLVFAIGSAVSGLGAVLFFLDVGFDPDSGLPLVLSGAVAGIVGGVRSPFGPLVGGIILGLLQGLVAWTFSSQWELAVTFGALIAALMLRPEGIMDIKLRGETQ